MLPGDAAPTGAPQLCFEMLSLIPHSPHPASLHFISFHLLPGSGPGSGGGRANCGIEDGHRHVHWGGGRVSDRQLLLVTQAPG